MNELSKSAVFFFSLLFLTVSSLSCARVEEAVRENPKTAIGATVGTVGGAVIGGTVFDSAGAAVAGGLLGGLAGGMIGRALESKNKEYASTARDYDFRSGQRTLVRIEDVDADPSRVDLREPVHLIARYALLPSDPRSRLNVIERWEINHNGQLVGNPVVTISEPVGPGPAQGRWTCPLTPIPGSTVRAARLRPMEQWIRESQRSACAKKQ